MINLTVCKELYDQGYITKEELILETKYNMDNVPKVVVVLYLVMIVPVVLLMKVSPTITKVMNKVARKVWIDRAVRIMK